MTKLLLILSLFATVTTQAQVSSEPTNLVCVAKDNDGMRPFVIASRVGVQMKKSDTGFDTMEDCQSALTVARGIQFGSIVCSSRDLDGNNPWDLVFINNDGASQKISPSTTTSFAECLDLSKKMIPSFEKNSAVYCVSRDGDAMAPFYAVNMMVDIGSTIKMEQSTDSFQTLQECWAFLGEK